MVQRAAKRSTKRRSSGKVRDVRSRLAAETQPVAVALPQEGFVRLPLVLAHVGLGKSTLWQMVRDKEFPAPIRLSARNVGWDVGGLRSWIAARIASAANGVPVEVV